jgi:hypothetical protein
LKRQRKVAAVTGIGESGKGPRKVFI